MREQSNTMRQLGRGGGSPNRQKGTQGRGSHGGRGFKTPPRMARRSARLIDQETRIQEGLIVQNEDVTTNPYSILEMDEEEEPDDEEMEDKIHEMQVVSPQRSPRRPAEKQTERDDASVGSMRRPSTRGKHETEGSKRNQEGVREEEMQVLEGRREDSLVEEGTLEGEDDEIGGKDEFMYASASKKA